MSKFCSFLIPPSGGGTAWTVLPGLFLVSVAPQSLAQIPVPATLDTLEVVTVQSTRQNVTPFEAPASVDLVSGEALREAQAQVNLSEGLGTVPGLMLQNRQNYAQDLQLSIRGFGARSTFGIRGVRLYIDGVPATMPDGQGQSSNIDIASIDRVEVLRGPFSALYGNSSGGVVQVYTRAGEAPPSVSSGLVLGSDGLRSVNLQGSGATAQADGLFSISRFETDGARAHSAATRDTRNARVGLALSDGSQVTLVLNDVHIRAQDPLGLTAQQFKDDPRQATPQAEQYNTRKTVDQTQGGLVWTRNIDADNDLQLMVYAGQRQTVQFQSIPAAVQAASTTHAGGVIDLARDYHGLDARWTRRLTLAGGPLTFVGGLSADALDEDRLGYENFVGTDLGVRGALRRDEDNRVSNLDPYAQLRWAFTERWSAEFGLRYSQVRFESDDHYIVTGNGDDSGGVRYSQLLPVAALSWQAQEGLNLYATAGRGFETPTFNELAYRPDGQAGLNFDLRPAVSTSVEIGAKQKTDVAGPGLLTAALFQTRTEDEIVTATNSGGRATYQNAGRTLRQGLELAWVTRWGGVPGGGAGPWRAQTAYTWLDATYRDGFAPGSAAQAGHRIPGIAREVAQAELAWSPPVGWRAGTQLRYVGRIAVNDGNTEYADAYTTLALYTGYAWRTAAVAGRYWDASVYGRVDNAADEVYAGSVIVNEGNGRYYEPAPGRSWSAGVNGSYRF